MIASCTLSSIVLIICLSVVIAFPLPLQNNYAGSAHPQEYVLSPDFEIKAEPTTRKYTFVVKETKAALDGFLRPVLAINGQIPGPLLEANEGDNLIITVINQLNEGLTLHWHGLYQNGSNWEDGVTGISQCPIPPHGGSYTYKFNLDGQFGTFWYHSHAENLMADGINGPLIVHSPRDPLKRYVDFDQEVVLMLADWYHNTSTEIVEHQLTTAGYFGTPAAPGPNSALINGVGEWNCSLATRSQKCKQITSVPEFFFKAGEKIRFRLINAGVHAMFFYSVDRHTLNLTEADATGIYGPPALHRIWLHNGQRYSVVINTREEDAGKSFYMRATMDSDCWAWVPNDAQLTAYGILSLTDRKGTKSKSITSNLNRSETRDWPDVTVRDCVDLETDSMVPIMKQSVPATVAGAGAFEVGFGFQFINNTSDYITRAEAVVLANKNKSSNSPFRPHTQPRTSLEKNSSSPFSGVENISPKSEPSLLGKRQVKVGEVTDLSFGSKPTPQGITRKAGPPPTPIGTIGKFFVNNITWTTYPYQPILHDLTPGGIGAVNSSRVAHVTYPRPEWYDLYLVNLDAAGSHPYHLHGVTMHLVARGKGLPTPNKLATLTYNTANPLRRDTVVVPPASFLVIRLLADIPGVWIVHCHIGWHIAAGFAGVVIIQPEVIKHFDLPKLNLELCDARIESINTIEPGK